MEYNEMKKLVKKWNKQRPKENIVDELMECANKLLLAYGIEAIYSEIWRNGYWCNIQALYVNMGDPYIPTIVYDVGKSKFYLMCWGDYVFKEEF